MLMVGQKFPDIKLPAVQADGTMVKDFAVLDAEHKGYTVVFFYPADFTFVCPTELVAFDKAMGEFESRKVRVLGASVDSAHSHAAWRRTPLNEGGIGGVNYPLLADPQRKLSGPLGILNADGVTYRASYLIDASGMIRHMVVNDLPLGRSVPEMLRVVDALQFFEQHGEVCPANWQKGDAGMGANRAATGKYLADKAA